MNDRRKQRPQMAQPLREPPNESQVQKLAEMFKPKQPPYTPISKSLEQVNIEPRIMDVFVENDLVECLVIPIQELIYKEWKHMTGANQSYQLTPKEDQDDDASRELQQGIDGPDA